MSGVEGVAGEEAGDVLARVGAGEDARVVEDGAVGGVLELWTVSYLLLFLCEEMGLREELMLLG